MKQNQIALGLIAAAVIGGIYLWNKNRGIQSVASTQVPAPSAPIPSIAAPATMQGSIPSKIVLAVNNSSHIENNRCKNINNPIKGIPRTGKRIYVDNSGQRYYEPEPGTAMSMDVFLYNPATYGC